MLLVFEAQSSLSPLRAAQDVVSEEGLKALDLRVRVLLWRLKAAKAWSLVGDWPRAEAAAGRAIGAGMLPEAPELLGGGGLAAHHSAAEAFLCRSRARLRLGRRGAQEDAAMAEALGRELGALELVEAAQGFRLQAEMAQRPVVEAAWAPEPVDCRLPALPALPALPELSKMPLRQQSHRHSAEAAAGSLRAVGCHGLRRQRRAERRPRT